jgi:hypothetical protein
VCVVAVVVVVVGIVVGVCMGVGGFEVSICTCVACFQVCSGNFSFLSAKNDKCGWAAMEGEQNRCVGYWQVRRQRRLVKTHHRNQKLFTSFDYVFSPNTIQTSTHASHSFSHSLTLSLFVSLALESFFHDEPRVCFGFFCHAHFACLPCACVVTSTGSRTN